MLKLLKSKYHPFELKLWLKWRIWEKFFTENRQYSLILLLLLNQLRYEVLGFLYGNMYFINSELDNKEKNLIKVINFNEFLKFLNLEIKFDLLNFNKWNSLSEVIRKIILVFQKTIKLSIDAIESSYTLRKSKKNK